jgi:hypothetical protein
VDLSARMIRSRLLKKFIKFLFFVFVLWSFYRVIPNDTEFSFAKEDSLEKIDWHDYEFINYEATRQGPGERSGYKLTDENEIRRNEELFKVFGLSIVVSEKVSLTRSLEDPRHEKYKTNFEAFTFIVFLIQNRCKELKYFKHLPSASVSRYLQLALISTFGGFLGDCDFQQRTAVDSSPMPLLHFQSNAQESSPRNHPRQ